MRATPFRSAARRYRVDLAWERITTALRAGGMDARESEATEAVRDGLATRDRSKHEGSVLYLIVAGDRVHGHTGSPHGALTGNLADVRLPSASPLNARRIVDEERVDVERLVERPDRILAAAEAEAGENRSSNQISESIYGEFGAHTRGRV